MDVVPKTRVKEPELQRDHDSEGLVNSLAATCIGIGSSQYIPHTLHGTAIYADQLTPQTTPIDRHILQSHGVYGYSSTRSTQVELALRCSTRPGHHKASVPPRT